MLPQPAPPVAGGRGGLAPLLLLKPGDRHRRAPLDPGQHHPQQRTDLRHARPDPLAGFPTCAARASQTPWNASSSGSSAARSSLLTEPDRTAVCCIVVILHGHPQKTATVTGSPGQATPTTRLPSTTGVVVLR